jgi:hypothetical protein
MMPSQMQTRVEYDLPTAVTFLVIGLTVGSLLTVLFTSPSDKGLSSRPSFGRRTPPATGNVA